MSIENMFQENPITNIRIYLRVANISLQHRRIKWIINSISNKETSLENHLEYNLLVLRLKWI
jgi:hypothetical protein